MAKKPKPVHTETPPEHEDESPPPPENKPDEVIEIGDAAYKSGDMVTIGGNKFTVETKKTFKASPKSGLLGGEYPVVSETLRNRKAYRAVVQGVTYPIRQYGTPNEVISKHRERRQAGTQARASRASDEAKGDENVIRLNRAATRVLEDYVALNRGEVDREGLLSELVTNHIGPEVERLKATQAAIARLPAERLELLANASEEKWQQILEMLK